MKTNNIIYKVTNKVNGKIYIGSTTNSLEKRWYQHVYDSEHNPTAKFQRAIKKYGKSKFKVEHFCTVLKESNLELVEHDLIVYHDSIKNGYNSIGLIKGSRELIKNTLINEWKDSTKRNLRIQNMMTSSAYRRTPVVSVSIYDGSIKYYLGIHEVRRAGFAISSIYACLDGSARTGQRYCWFYKEGKFSDLDYKNKAKQLIGEFKTDFLKPILGINGQNPTLYFKDIFKASEITNIPIKNIRRHLKGDKGYDKIVKGWQFKYV